VIAHVCLLETPGEGQAATEKHRFTRYTSQQVAWSLRATVFL
jgi:hypothetical protein